MKRRAFVGAAGGLAGILSSGAAPALAQGAPAEVKWRLASSFPKSLDTLHGAADALSKRVAAATGGRFQIQVFAAGEVVPALQVADAVQNGTVQCGHTAPYYYVGKDPTFAFGTAVPFGLNARQINAWWYAGGGEALMNEFFREHGFRALLAGNTGAQMGGWYRKEIKGVADLKGLKLRTAGMAGEVLSRLGVVPQQLGAGEVYSALEKGTLDGAEFVGPYDDEKLGLAKVAKYYYYPGWWEGGAALALIVNLKAWEALPREWQAILEAAAHEANTLMLARYDAANPAALRKIVAAGGQLRAFPRPVLEAGYQATQALFAEIAAKNPRFRKVLDHQSKFLEDQVLWFRVAEAAFDNFMVTGRKSPAAAPAKAAPKK